jgi:hypothetical protein
MSTTTVSLYGLAATIRQRLETQTFFGPSMPGG